MTPWSEVKAYGNLINEQREYDMRFKAALAGMDLDASSSGSSGNEAWRQAMRAKQNVRHQ